MTTARELLQQLDDEFNAPNSVMRGDVYKQRHGELTAQIEIEERAGAPRSPSSTAALFNPQEGAGTNPQLIARLADIERRFDLVGTMAQVYGARIKALQERVKKLESQSSIHIHATGDVTVPGFNEVVDAVARLDETMRAPVVPEYDARGKLVQARRQIERHAGARSKPRYMLREGRPYLKEEPN